MPGIHHLDLVVSDPERSLPFYRGLLGPLGYVREGGIEGERGERVVYLGHIAEDAAIGLRERRSDAKPVPYDRYGVGVHHVALSANDRGMADERAAWLREQGAEIESGPAEYGYIPGYYAVLLLRPRRHQARSSTCRATRGSRRSAPARRAPRRAARGARALDG